MAGTFNAVVNTDTFQVWLDRTNDLVTFAEDTLSVGGGAAAVTGNAVVNGSLQLETLHTDTISGGAIGSGGLLTISTNATFGGATSTLNSNVVMNANVTFNGANLDIASGTKFDVASITDFTIQATRSTDTQVLNVNPSNKQLEFYDIRDKLLFADLLDADFGSLPTTNNVLGVNSGAGANVSFTTYQNVVTAGALGQHINAASADLASANIATMKVEDLTDNRIVIAGTGGELEDDAQLTYDGTTLSLGSTFSITNATGVVAVGGISSSNLTSGRIVLAGSAGALNDDGNLTFDGGSLATTANVDITGNIDVSGDTDIGGDTSVGGGLSVSNNITVGMDVTVDGRLLLDNTNVGGSHSSATVLFGGLKIDDQKQQLKRIDPIYYESNSTLDMTAAGGSNLIIDGDIDQLTGHYANVASLKVRDLTDNRVVIVGTDGELEDSSEFTFDGNELNVSGANANFGSNTLFIADGGGVGIHETEPEARLHVAGDVVISGDITTSYTSDQRLKENITPLDNPIETLNQIKGVNFDWIAGIDREFSDYISPKQGHDIGVIAQDVEKVLPEAIQYYPDGYMGVNYPKLVPVLLEAIKHLNNRVEQLESQVSKNGHEG